MKKLILSLAVIATTGSLFAQRPVDGANPFSLEGQVSLNSASGNTFAAPTIRFRYFVMDNLSLRLGATFNSMSSKQNFYGSVAAPMNYEDSVGTVTTKSMAYNFSIGAAYHFSQLEKLSPYVGIDFVIGGAIDRQFGENSDNNTWIDEFQYETKTPGIMFGGNIVAGVDWYFAQNVYLGAEFGWGVSSVSYKDITTSVTVAGTTTETVTPVTGSAASMLSLGHNFIGGLRLGWRF